jgi:hypothetical protein
MMQSSAPKKPIKGKSWGSLAPPPTGESGRLDFWSGLVRNSRQVFDDGLLGDPHLAAGFPLNVGQSATSPFLIQQLNGYPQSGRSLFAGQ